MRIAVLSDIHGNLAALDAVLRDARDEAVSAYWVLGDLVAYGPRPAEVVERVRALPSLKCVRGNTDRYVMTGSVAGMIPPVEEGPLVTEIRESLSWTRRRVCDAGHEAWLATRPVEERGRLPDGTRVLLVHASPGRDDGPGVRPGIGEDELTDLGFAADVADMVLVGHTHLALDRRFGAIRVVNPGPVSLPPSRDGVARWALLTADDGGVEVTLRGSTYDVTGVVSDLDDRGHPSAGWIAAKLGASR